MNNPSILYGRREEHDYEIIQVGPIYSYETITVVDDVLVTGETAFDSDGHRPQQQDEHEQTTSHENSPKFSGLFIVARQVHLQAKH